MNIPALLDKVLLGQKLAGSGLNYRPLGLAPVGPAREPNSADLMMQRRGLQYQPMSPLRGLAAGGLRGVGQALMAWGSGRPELVGQAFSGGLDAFNQDQARREAQARDDELFGMQVEEHQAGKTERQRKLDAEAKAKADSDAAIDRLVQAGALDAAEGDAMKAGVGGLGDFMKEPDAFKPDITEFFGPNNTKYKGYLDENGEIKKVGESAPLYEPNEGPAPTETERLMRLAGIDPASPEGKKILANKLQGEGGGGPKVATPKELRDEYTKANKEYEQALYGYGKVVSAAKDPSPAGDIALIFGFMKTLDPGSTVREGEFATAQQAGGVPERIVALYNQVIDGTRLTESQRADFIAQAGGQFKVYQDRKGVADQFYSGLAERSGVNPQDVLVPYGTVPQYTPGRGGPTDERNRGAKVVDGVRIERLE
jgi:hypothetical protein